jgi:hypothetical protein
MHNIYDGEVAFTLWRTSAPAHTVPQAPFIRHSEESIIASNGNSNNRREMHIKSESKRLLERPGLMWDTNSKMLVSHTEGGA